jgi:hypothetical protein
MNKMMSASDAKWHFYECMESKDFENASSYFETLWYHYQRRGVIIRNGYKIALKIRELQKKQ